MFKNVSKKKFGRELIFQVARCTKIITSEGHEPRYLINVKQFAKFVVDLADTVAPTDIEEGMRVGVDRNKYQIHLPLPAKIDPSVTMMQVNVCRILYLKHHNPTYVILHHTISDFLFILFNKLLVSNFLV